MHRPSRCLLAPDWKVPLKNLFRLDPAVGKAGARTEGEHWELTCHGEASGWQRASSQQRCGSGAPLHCGACGLPGGRRGRFWTQGLRSCSAMRNKEDTLAQRLLDRAAHDGGGETEVAGRNEDAHRSSGHCEELEDSDEVSGCVMPWKRLLAVCFIALAVATWVTEIQITNDVLGGEDAYDNAYFMVWLAHNASGVLGLFIALVLGCFLPPPSDGQQSLKDLILHPTRDIMVNSFYLSSLVNFTSWTWFLSIPMTEAMVNTVIYQSCCVWCFLISVVLLGEKVTLIKVVSTLATFAGVGIISNFPCTVEVAPGTTPSPADAGANGRMLWGDLLCLFSAFTYALYEVLLKMWGAGGHGHSIELRECDSGRAAEAAQEAGYLRTPEFPTTSSAGIVTRLADAHDAHDDHHRFQASTSAAHGEEGGLRSSVESAVFVGWMGIWNLLILWAPLAICHYTGYQEFHLPNDVQAAPIALDCLLEGAYLVWLVLAIALSSPLFVTIGTVLAIPSSAAMDALLHGILCPTMSLVGTGLVVFGFVGVNVAMVVDGRPGWPSWL